MTHQTFDSERCLAVTRHSQRTGPEWGAWGPVTGHLLVFIRANPSGDCPGKKILFPLMRLKPQPIKNGVITQEYADGAAAARVACNSTAAHELPLQIDDSLSYSNSINWLKIVESTHTSAKTKIFQESYPI